MYQHKLEHIDKLSSISFCLDINLAVFSELPTYLGQMVLREFVFTKINAADGREFLS